jgi:hypothetical protein
MSQPPGLNALVLPPSPLLTNPENDAAKAQEVRPAAAQRDSFSTAEIRQFVQTPGRLREGFILNELLKPPVALRGGLYPRRRPSGS